MSYCEAHSYNHEIVSGCPRCLDNKRCLQIGGLVMEEEVKDAEIAALREALEWVRANAHTAWGNEFKDIANKALEATK